MACCGQSETSSSNLCPSLPVRGFFFREIAPTHGYAATRETAMAFFSRIPRCVVGLEACATAHYWARELAALGHEVRPLGDAAQPGLPAGRILPRHQAQPSRELTARAEHTGVGYRRSRAGGCYRPVTSGHLGLKDGGCLFSRPLILARASAIALSRDLSKGAVVGLVLPG
jgi:hypothetical protein